MTPPPSIFSDFISDRLTTVNTGLSKYPIIICYQAVRSYDDWPRLSLYWMLSLIDIDIYKIYDTTTCVEVDSLRPLSSPPPR